MPRYFINEKEATLIMIDEQGLVYPFKEAYEAEYEEEEVVEEEVEAPKKGKSKTRGGGAVDSDEEKKAKKREYMRQWLAKKKNKQAEKAEPSMTIAESKKEIEELGIPMELVNKFGRTAVEVVLNEKNRGIGYTADEIFEQRDKRLKIFTLEEVTEMVEALEEAGL